MIAVVFLFSGYFFVANRRQGKGLKVVENLVCTVFRLSVYGRCRTLTVNSLDFDIHTDEKMSVITTWSINDDFFGYLSSYFSYITSSCFLR